jgi:hypothetical protein
VVVAVAESEGGGGSILPEGSVKLPGVGRVKKVYVVAGGAVVLVAAVVWYRKRKAASLAASSGGITTDPAGNVGVLDPATGFVYGSAEDQSALADLGTGTGNLTGGSGSAGGGDGSSSGGGDIGTQVSTGPPFTSNAAWTQYVTAYLVGTLGMDPGTVANDLGKYIAGQPVTQAERDGVIQPALAYGGPPPVAGANGFPPSISVTGSVSGTGGTPGAPTLSLGAVTDTAGVVKWAAVSGATGYAWTASGPSYSKTGSGAGTSVSLSGLKAGSSYTVAVHATNAAGAGPTASITVKTKATSTTPSGSYAEVHVVAYHSASPAWNSTISGIAQHYGYGGDWESVWNDPKNASLRAKRGDPNHIQAGDTVWVKRK